jgi:hypothetical protein
MSGRFILEYASSIPDDLAVIERKHHRAIRDAIIEQLSFEPLVETRNRKPLDPKIMEATWELRCGLNNKYRVLYDTDLTKIEATEDEPLNIVRILAIGEKRGERLFIAGEEWNP